MFDSNSDMTGKNLEPKIGTSTLRIFCVAVLALTLTCAATTSFANPSSDYTVATQPASVSQAFPTPPSRAESAAAMFMVGLVSGMVGGIGLFFIHLRRREKRLARFSLDEMMLDNWPPSSESPSWSPPSPTTSPWDSEPSDEMIEKSDPWERSVDWWKNPDDQ